MTSLSGVRNIWVCVCFEFRRDHSTIQYFVCLLLKDYIHDIQVTDNIAYILFLTGKVM